MDFNRLLRHSDVSTDKHTVGIAIYYLDEITDAEPVRTERIREVIKETRRRVNLDNVSAYPSQLADDNLVAKRDGGYILTNEGRNYYESLYDLPEEPAEPRDGRFIDVDYDNGQFYPQLINDINTSYQTRVYDATLVLTRKLFESLLIDILRGEFGRKNTPLFFNPDTGQYRQFSTLIENFEEQADVLRKYSLTVADEEFIEKLESFRHDGNESAHSIEVDIDDDEIEAKSDDATRVAEILFNVWKKIQIVEQNADEKTGS